ncbi:tetratricopeptide repeat protein [Corynebacterium sp. HMSC04H06]|uniref:tetratricopeptide repeat protein n=1 Tax=Corynebacterium sp. HMSC04H06 TaxID=1581050 RepID=UPI0008A1FD6A|nr:tetratricopeptide repeat protein [Corynebacterium sp. HMSC04H06]OFS21154.1 co-chaperone YbbN [Corynebacterium sp. HMSC04H06]
MTNPRGPQVAGALDLGEVKARAEARAQAEKHGAQSPAQGAEQSGAGAGLRAFFEVTEANFESDLVRRSLEVPVVALIGTARSTQSEELKSNLRQLAERGGFKFLVGYIDADQHPQIAQVFGVRNLPTTIALGAGQPLTNFEGTQPMEALEQWMDALVQQVSPQLQGPGPELQAAQAGQAPAGEEEAAPAEDSRLSEAEGQLGNGDFDGAIATYEAILAEKPGNQEIKQARDTTLLLKRLSAAGQGVDHIGQADAHPDDIDAQLDAADADVVAGRPEAAFARLIAGLRRTAGADKDRLKERLLELFGLFDAADPRVLSARTQLASALY